MGLDTKRVPSLKRTQSLLLPDPHTYVWGYLDSAAARLALVSYH
ncbi:MAG TPA: hypothetical protein VF447_09500 [Terriglobales bacterium]